MLKPFAVAMLCATPAAAADCFPLSDIVAALDRSFGEAETVRAAEDRGGMVIVFTSEDGTWTMVVVAPNGTACPVATGTRWMMVAPTF
jgi:hypothetical protein